MTLFFISSPGQMAHRALALMNKHKFKDLTIVTTKSIKPFFEDKVDAKIVTLDVEPNLITKKTKTSLLTNAIKSKLEYNRLFKGIENEDIYLFFTSWGIVPISYVKRLSKKNNVYVYPEDFLENMYDEETGLIATAMKLSAKMLLDLDVYIVKWNDVPVWELKLNSFPMTVIKQDDFSNKLPEEFFIDKELLEGKTVLFLGSKFEIDCEESEDKIELTDKVMGILDEKFKGCYSIKAHPIDKTLYGKMNNSDSIIPAHYLSESLCNHDWKIIIGYHSEALVSAKRHTNAKVVSLVKLYEFTNPKVRKYWIDTFEKEGILMPNNIEELEEYLKC